MILSAHSRTFLFNIGSGVSIVKVTGHDKFERISGSSLGGGTFWGLARLLLECKNFDEIIQLTNSGENSNVDMLVGDIYGGSYESLGLDAGVIAASFGKATMRGGGGSIGSNDNTNSSGDNPSAATTEDVGSEKTPTSLWTRVRKAITGTASLWLSVLSPTLSSWLSGVNLSNHSCRQHRSHTQRDDLRR